jgi:hypothetical protein
MRRRRGKLIKKQQNDVSLKEERGGSLLTFSIYIPSSFEAFSKLSSSARSSAPAPRFV